MDKHGHNVDELDKDELEDLVAQHYTRVTPDVYGFVDNLEWRIVEVHHNDPSGPHPTRLWSVRDGVDGLPTWRPDSYAVFVPFRPDGHPICSTEQDPPRFPAVCVRNSFIRAFGDKFGDPRVVEGHGFVFGHGTVLCSYVVVAMTHHERG